MNIDDLKLFCVKLGDYIDSVEWPIDTKDGDDMSDIDYKIEEMLETMQSAYEEAVDVIDRYDNK